MAKYSYKGKNIYGDITEGVYEASTEQGVYDMLKSKEYYALSVKKIIERKDVFDIDFQGKISQKELMIFCKQFSVVLKAGIPMLHALSMVHGQMSSKAMKDIIADLMKEIQKGSSLTQAIQNHEGKIPSMMIYMIEAGESSGTLDKSLDSLYKHFEKTYKLQKKVRSALTYPIMVVIVAFAVTIAMMVLVVPTFIKLFEESGKDLPLPTVILINTSKFFTNNWLIILVVIVGLLLVYKVYSITVVGGLNVDRLKLKLPPFAALNIRNVSSRFCRTMATLLAAGVGITESLDISSKVVGNKYVSKLLEEVRYQVIAGKGLHDPLVAADCFPPMLLNMVQMGEESGTIESMLDNAAGVYEEEVDSATQRITDMLQPAVIIVLGVIVGFIVLAVALPLFSMY